MYTKTRYSVKDMIRWTRLDLFTFFLIAFIPTVLYDTCGLTWLYLPWLPIAMIGTAVAFIIGFQNKVTYDRIWEARKIWGGIVNVSRTWGALVKDTVTGEHASQPVDDVRLKQEVSTLIHRHIAWMAALRHSMRSPKSWEVFLSHKTNREWAKMMHIPEREHTLEEDLKPLLSEEEFTYVLSKTNKATALLAMQSKHLRKLKEEKLIWEFAFLDLEGLIKDLYDLQGKSERIKNFPYPRQYATLNSFFVWILVFFLPFGVIPEFAKVGEQIALNFPRIGDYFVWAAVPFSMIVSWVFHTMERIGKTGENPFEGSANDVPISTIARGIEIDLREMIDEDPEQIPKPYPLVHHTQM
ncbi:hypothetical protein KFE98_16450 [bacterium SCSIO 12741]|nr:hypothetical protein KFE98_16450 [bacterium SCSIO 12741]